MRQKQAYLLQLWNDGEGHDTWRASLNNIHTREPVNFAGLEALLHHLKNESREKRVPDKVFTHF
jgi:hypothetical protein